jgi:hypothetical protein
MSVYKFNRESNKYKRQLSNKISFLRNKNGKVNRTEKFVEGGTLEEDSRTTYTAVIKADLSSSLTHLR